MKLPYARAAVALLVTSSLGAALTQLAGGCQASPTVVPVRSLNGSGKVSFVCLSPNEPTELPLGDCNANQFTSICQYEYQDDAGVADAEVTYDDAGNPVATLLPHLYALVTQRTHGQVAVIDTSAIAGGVLNENPLEPGASFLPVGANPTGIASTPGSVATFVGVAETGKEGLFAIPSSLIRPASSFGVPDTCIGPGDASVTPPQLTSWPACHLPAAPGDVLLIDDPALENNTVQRLTCDGAYVPIDARTQPLAYKESFHGRSKIVLSLPSLGGIAVLDAQELLSRAPGSFDDCAIERWFPLTVNLTGLAAQPAPLPTNACGNAAPQTLALASSYSAQPGGMSYANGKLYVADLAAPVIHVLEMMDAVPGLGVVPTPCRIVEQAPLLPTSIDEPARVVSVSKVSVAPNAIPDMSEPTPSSALRQYLYANDTNDPLGGSLMVFDVGPNSTSRRPLVRQHPEWNPFQPRDRVRFAAPAADIVVVERDIPAIDPVTGVAPQGVLCDPNPNAVTCIDTAHNCDLGTSYRTSTDYTTGAGPQLLRGEFAFAALTDGKVAVIDVADFDTLCRGPVADTTLAGCSGTASNLVTSEEVSCNVVKFDEPRSSNYEAVGSQPGNHVPGIQTYPLLYAADGSVLGSTSVATAPRMVATLPLATSGEPIIPSPCLQSCDPLGCGVTCDTLPGCPLELFVGGEQIPLDLRGAECTTACEPNGAPCTVTSECCGGLGGSTCVVQAPCTPATAASVCRTGVCPKSGTCEAAAPTTPAAGALPVGVCEPDACQLTAGTYAPCVPESATDPNCNAELCAKSGNWASPSLPQAFQPGGIGANNTLAMNLEDTRAQVADQSWTVTYEGAIPGFQQKLATLALQVPTPAEATVTEPTSQFCDHGVLGERAFAEMLAAQPKATTLTAAALADYVQVTSDFPSADDSYWIDQSTCDYGTCLDAFGPIDQPSLYETRDLRIVEAYEDHLEVEQRHPSKQIDLNLIRCCFPGAISFTVRTGSQWSVVASQTGFIHHVVADSTPGPTLGACRNACDPIQERKNGRLLETPATLFPAPIPDRAPGEMDPSPSFQNPMFRFGIFGGRQLCTTNEDCGKGPTCVAGVCVTETPLATPATCTTNIECGVGNGVCESGSCFTARVSPAPTARDSTFKFSTNGSFTPLLIGLATDSSLIEPFSMTYLPATTELAVVDGALNGLIMVSLSSAGVSRSFY